MRWPREAGLGLVFALLAVALTWPLAASPGQAVSVRPDYLSNLWNFWWADVALFQQGISPYWTDRLHHPDGISLARHTLSLLNAVPGALLSRVVDPHDAFKILLLAHFWLSAWTFFLFARALTGSLGGAVLAGLFWSFAPYHLYYAPQINVATLELLPLAGWLIVRTYRHGRVTDMSGVAVSAALLAAVGSYDLVFAAMLGALLWAGGRWWSPETPFARGSARLGLAALGAGALAALVAWPLLAEAGLSAMEGEGPAGSVLGSHRSNDLLGFLWVGAPERVLVSWPTMLGYTTLTLLLLGWRGVLRQPFWILFALLFFVLGLGPQLTLAGRATGLALPYAALTELPLLSMLRKPDRFLALVQVGVGVLLAASWCALSARMSGAAVRRVLWTLCALALLAERAAVPWRTYALPVSPVFAELARDDTIAAVVHLPFSGGGPPAARSNWLQTLHGQPIPEGYVTSLALDATHERAEREWKRAQDALGRGRADALLRRLDEAGVDVVVLHKTELRPRRPGPLDGRTLWTPFVLRAPELVAMRQLGHLVEQPREPARLAVERAALEILGEPVFEDDALAVFRRR